MRISGIVAASRSVGAALRSPMTRGQRAAEPRPLGGSALEVWDPTFAIVPCPASGELGRRRRADALAGVLPELACARSGMVVGLRQASSRGGGLGIWCR